MRDHDRQLEKQIVKWHEHCKTPTVSRCWSSGIGPALLAEAQEYLRERTPATWKSWSRRRDKECSLSLQKTRDSRYRLRNLLRRRTLRRRSGAKRSTTRRKARKYEKVSTLAEPLNGTSGSSLWQDDHVEERSYNSYSMKDMCRYPRDGWIPIGTHT